MMCHALAWLVEWKSAWRMFQAFAGEEPAIGGSKDMTKKEIRSDQT